MRKTLNEVSRLCQKAAEGAGAPAGLDSEAAHSAVWLLSRDLPALDDLVAALRLTEQEGHSACRFNEDVPLSKSAVLDASNKAGALLAPALVDLLVARAVAGDGLGRLVATALSAPQFLLPRAAYYSREGWCFQFNLTDRHGTLFVLRVTPTEGIIILGSCRAAGVTALARMDGVCLEAICARRSNALPDIAETELSLMIDNQPLRVLQARSQTNGVMVVPEQWERLQAYSRQVLVPATEASRIRGAGAQNSDNM